MVGALPGRAHEAAGRHAGVPVHGRRVVLQTLERRADVFKLKDATGALIGDVVPKGPADKAGLKDGDVVLDYNGKKVTDSRRLKLAVGETKPGTTVPVKILRDGSTRTLEVTVQQLTGSDQLA